MFQKFCNIYYLKTTNYKNKSKYDRCDKIAEHNLVDFSCSIKQTKSVDYSKLCEWVLLYVRIIFLIMMKIASFLLFPYNSAFIQAIFSSSYIYYILRVLLQFYLSSLCIYDYSETMPLLRMISNLMSDQSSRNKVFYTCIVMNIQNVNDACTYFSLFIFYIIADSYRFDKAL